MSVDVGLDALSMGRTAGAVLFDFETRTLDETIDALATVGQTMLRRLYLGNGLGEIDPPGRAGYAYVHQRDPDGNVRDSTWVLNPLGLSGHGLPVLVGYSPRSRNLEILNVDFVTMAAFYQGQTGALARVLQNHGLTHDLFVDPVFISNRQVRELAVHPTEPRSMAVQVHAGLYWRGARVRWFPGVASADLSSYVPATAGQALWLLLSIDTSVGILAYTAGAEFTADTDPKQSIYNDLVHVDIQKPAGHRPLSLVYLLNGMSTIGWKHIHRADLAALDGDDATGWLLDVTGRSELEETTILG